MRHLEFRHICQWNLYGNLWHGGYAHLKHNSTQEIAMLVKEAMSTNPTMIKPEPSD